MAYLSDRLRAIWVRTFTLSWPIAVQQFLNTMMRTVDILVVGLFSPAAVSAVGVADLYTDIPRRIGAALGTGAITLASQDTGRAADASRDAAITQAIILAIIAGMPFVLVGLTLGELAIDILGAEREVVRLGGIYLAIIFLIAPFRIVAHVGASALQGTGDTRTPMLINGGSNALNIVGTVLLGLGLGPVPAYGIVGVAAATAVSRVLEAVAILLALLSHHTDPTYTRPRSLTVTRQLLVISTPRFGEQLSMGLVLFPFNALLLMFGTEPNAGYHIGRRLYQQIGGPIYRTFGTASSIIVGQHLGAGDPEEARYSAYGILSLGLLTIGIIAVAIFASAPWVTRLFSDDPATIAYATTFTQAFAAGLVFMVVLRVFAGGLRSAGDTLTPLYAEFTGQFGFMLGFSYLFSVVLGFGIPAIYLGIFLTYVWSALFMTWQFRKGDWIQTAESLIGERADAFD